MYLCTGPRKGDTATRTGQRNKLCRRNGAAGDSTITSLCEAYISRYTTPHRPLSTLTHAVQSETVAAANLSMLYLSFHVFKFGNSDTRIRKSACQRSAVAADLLGQRR